MPPELSVRPCTDTNAVLSDLAHTGLALINNVGEPRDLLNLAQSLGTVIPHPDSDSDGVTVIEDRGAHAAALAGFTRSALSPHTDRSGVADPPGLLLTACGRAAVSGGESTLVDGAAVYDDLASVAPDALDALCTPRTVLFGGGDGHLGAVFTRNDRTVAIRFRLDALVRFAPAVTPHLPALRAAIARNTMTLPVRIGSGYVLNNHRWLHGRCAFEGPRRMYRVTAHPKPGSPTPGFAPGGSHLSGASPIRPRKPLRQLAERAPRLLRRAAS